MTDLQTLIQKIKQKGWQLDDEELEQLRQPGNLAILMEMFQSNDTITHTDAANALIAFQTLALPDMLQELKKGNLFRRSSAAGVLGSVGDFPTLADLLAALKNQDYHVRSEAAEALGSLRDIGAVPGLIEAMSDQSGGVFAPVVYALQEIALEHDVPELHELLSHDDPHMRLGAAYALEDKAGAAGIQGFIDLVRYGITGDQHEFEKAVKCVGNIGKPAVPAMIKILEDDDEVMRRFAVYSLSRIADPSALPALTALVSDPDRDVQQDVITGLAEFGEDALALLLELVISDNDQIRWCAQRALSYIGVPAVNDLFKLLGIEDEAKRKTVAGTLWMIQANLHIESVLDRLIASLHDENRNVQKGAAEALALIRRPEALAAVDEWRRSQQNQR